MWNFTNNYKNGTLINIVHVGITWLFPGRYKQTPAHPRWGTCKRPKKCFPPSLTEWSREITGVPTGVWFRGSFINEKPILASGTAQKSCIPGPTCPVCRRHHQDSPFPWHRVLWILFVFFWIPWVLSAVLFPPPERSLFEERATCYASKHHPFPIITS